MDKTPEEKIQWHKRLRALFPRKLKNQEDLIQLLRDSSKKALLEPEVLSMIEGVMQVSDMQVRDIMVPRQQMTVIQANSSLKDLLPAIIESGHSRFPVVGNNRDQIVGILLAKDILKYFIDHRLETFNINDVIRPTTFVPESKHLDSLLKEFRRTHNHLAIVVDEYGGIAGLVTIEDVLEQIVGDIEDEYDIDEESEFIRKHNDHEFTINALTPIEDFNEYFQTDWSDEEFDTIGGLVLHEFGHLPKRNETAIIDKFKFTVLNADNRRIKLLRLVKL